MATRKASGGSKGRKTVSKATKKVTKARQAPARKAATATGKGAGTKQAAARKTARKPAGKAAKTVRKPAKQVAKKTGRKPAKKVAKKAVRKPSKKVVARKTARQPVKKAVARTPARKPAKKAKAGGITPAQALANTRKLLREKQAHDRQTPPWQAIEAGPGHAGQPGYQSAEAAQRAEELHAGESRMPAIQGSIGTRQRHNQGKRDSR